ncbi:MAG: ABC transporter permease [Longimicrobiales bacterium]
MARASAPFLPLLGGRPALGRWLMPHEEGATAPNVVLLSYAQWVTPWGADPNVLGRTVRFNTTTYEIIGVMPRDLDVRGLHPRAERDAASFWIPIGTEPSDFQAFSQNYEAIVRLAPGVTAQTARDELYTLMRGHRAPPTMACACCRASPPSPRPCVLR